MIENELLTHLPHEDEVPHSNFFFFFLEKKKIRFRIDVTIPFNVFSFFLFRSFFFFFLEGEFWIASQAYRGLHKWSPRGEKAVNIGFDSKKKKKR